MAVAGVVAEYNVFHQGHAWQLRELRRRLGADTAVVVCMSGNFVQRGDFAILSKHARAEMALLGGADLVLELPTPWSAAAAERFAGGAAAVLAATGVVTHLVFGCECGSLEPLSRVAACLDRELYHTAVRRFLRQGVTFAAARQAALELPELAGTAAACLAQPNNALAVEYLRSLGALGSTIVPVALPRVGAPHDSQSPGEEYPSASAIRAMLLSGGSWRAGVPDTTASVTARELAAGRGPVSALTCERALLSRLRTMPEEAFAAYDGGGEGLYRRFYRAVHSAATVEGVLQAAKTKRYPLSRLRRMLLHSYLDVRTPGKRPPYLRVLGANGAGRALLKSMRGTAALPVLTKPGHVRRLDQTARNLFALESRCTDLYTLAYPALEQSLPGIEYTANPVML